jgi:ketosteroid isomerase-like protein
MTDAEQVPTETERIVRGYLGSFAGRDPDAIAAHVSDDFVNEHTAALGEGCRGRAAYRERLPGFLADMHELRYEVEDVIVDGSRAAVAYTMHARWQGDRPISVRGVQRLRVAGGLVSERVDYWDAADFLLQADPAAAAVLGPLGVRAAARPSAAPPQPDEPAPR